ncbi:sterol desaturase family protein [Nostoc sp. FACHB-87]|uniref:sterol desaturase family protein n=1 Tax=Nostocaceae TaxID=1162 RepID=UPI0016827EEC|nr:MULTISPECIES: sterol desaturase family protein [Nostocaceae]MBD2301254.1 sterol desaturase family protein [Nostoc sp. FACHB-190]MBD2456118.1 sterol desaturase family protein [Nostoc sp. FACHB-87]MBD2473869.1 sterol desaturase family protein [Anabaena sp. FACHB-83]
MKKFFDFCFEVEFYLKIAISCTIIQQMFYWLLHNIELNFITQVLLYWMTASVSFYSIGFFIEKVIKQNGSLRDHLTVRAKKVKKQSFPVFTAKGIIIGELRSFIAALIILYLAPEVTRGNSWLLNFGWFLMRIIAADFCFYVSHWLLHRKFFQKIHLKHHEFADSSSFVAGHKSLTEYIIVTITDLLPIFIFGYDITQLLAWTIIGNAYNLEGHSSLSIFFVPSDFHDLHHTCFKRNYGIQGFWDRVFKTLNPPTKKTGLIFPVASLEQITMKYYSD